MKRFFTLYTLANVYNNKENEKDYTSYDGIDHTQQWGEQSIAAKLFNIT
jgi:hypothetical protein